MFKTPLACIYFGERGIFIGYFVNLNIPPYFQIWNLNKHHLLCILIEQLIISFVQKERITMCSILLNEISLPVSSKDA